MPPPPLPQPKTQLETGDKSEPGSKSEWDELVKAVVGADSPESPISIVSSKDYPDRAYPTLEAACTAAEDGAIIELRFNGTRDTTEKPFHIKKKKLTIRAAKGFRPVIVFEPAEIPAEGFQTRMVTLTGGSMEFVNIDFLMNVVGEVSTDQWADVRTHRVGSISIDRL